MMSIDHLQLKRSLPRVLSSLSATLSRGDSAVPPSPSLGLPGLSGDDMNKHREGWTFWMHLL